MTTNEVTHRIEEPPRSIKGACGLNPFKQKKREPIQTKKERERERNQAIILLAPWLDSVGGRLPVAYRNTQWAGAA